ncbi:MAG: LptF/LptG family permease [Breznakibacter sp.]
MKKLHLFILKSFTGPLVMTFFISLFILVMQFLWKYVDDLVGKGLEWYVLAELLFYASLQVVPMALPLAILLASLMTFGNLGENYELTAIKSAGVSLPRIMLPLIVLIAIVSYGAFKFSNNMLPVANLKLTTLIYDVRQTRPELDIKERIFYEGVGDFTIKIDDKNRQTNMMYNLMIYDHRDRLSRNSNVTLADSGSLKVSHDKKNMILTLYQGVRYDEKASNERRRLKPREMQSFRTDVFESQTALIELRGFDFSRSDEGLFKSSDKMKNLGQLKKDEDSIRKVRVLLVNEIGTRIKHNYFVRARSYEPADTVTRLTAIDKAKPLNTDSVVDAMKVRDKQKVVENALRQARDVKMNIEEQSRAVENEDKKIARHQMEMHRKFTLSFACLIFFFIGAPLGAIIRKGGLGMPVVVSVLFFIVYYIVNTFGEKMAREGIWDAWQGMWLSSFVLLPVGIFLTYKSATDSALLNSDAYVIAYRRFLSRFKKDKAQ